MNKCFRDNDQKTIVKVLASVRKVQKEIAGAEALSKFVVVPSITRLDKQTIAISIVTGVDIKNVSKDIVNDLVIKFLKKIKGANSFNLSIFSEIDILKKTFSNNPGILMHLQEIENKVAKTKLFPVHGDLQKQNMFIQKGKLALIDFEHFLFAPRELEIVNSLFFKDHNCMDADFIIKNLTRDKVFDPEMLPPMLTFYAIKQIADGRRKSDCQKRLQDGMKRLENIFKYDTRLVVPKLKDKSNYDWLNQSEISYSTCFA